MTIFYIIQYGADIFQAGEGARVHIQKLPNKEEFKIKFKKGHKKDKLCSQISLLGDSEKGINSRRQKDSGNHSKWRSQGTWGCTKGEVGEPA
jgi:hypothetical protein